MRFFFDGLACIRMDNQDRCDRHCGGGLKKVYGSAYIWTGNLLNEVWIVVPSGEHDNIGQQSLELPLFDTSPE
ncbi:MAG: hypothetical protein KAI29_16300 [Cyclobacteriaceae bacterium]|nr:hypothetical protein [Cyclobacteriaceae bacterium]